MCASLCVQPSGLPGWARGSAGSPLACCLRSASLLGPTGRMYPGRHDTVVSPSCSSHQPRVRAGGCSVGAPPSGPGTRRIRQGGGQLAPRTREELAPASCSSPEGKRPNSSHVGKRCSRVHLRRKFSGTFIPRFTLLTHSLTCLGGGQGREPTLGVTPVSPCPSTGGNTGLAR